MNDEQAKSKTEADAELEREIRADRKFTLSEAIGRMAGPGAMKGVSPVDLKQQGAAEVQEYIRQHLVDAGGVLGGILLRFVKESELFLKGFEQPLVTLEGFIRLLLGSEYALKELVRQADVEWGQVFGERPHFEKEGSPPDPDDPYTFESVRTALTQLATGLAEGKA
jgi:hypothetical protein